MNLEKRKANELSPTTAEEQSKTKVIRIMGDDRKIGEMSIKDMKDLIAASLANVTKDLADLKETMKTLAEENKSLKLELEKLRGDRDSQHRQMMSMEDHIKRKNVIFKGLASHISLSESVRKVCLENLKMQTPVIVKSTKKIYDSRGKMGVIVELDSEDMVEAVFKSTRNLAGSTISVERDLNSERQQKKKVLLQLKKDLSAVNNNHRISVRNDRMKLDDKWFFWSKENELVCGRDSALPVIRSIYGDSIRTFNFNYFDLLQKVNSK